MTALTAIFGLLAGRSVHQDRFANATAAGHRRGRRHDHHAISDPLFDARAVQLLRPPRTACFGRQHGALDLRALEPPKGQTGRRLGVVWQSEQHMIHACSSSTTSRTCAFARAEFALRDARVVTAAKPSQGIDQVPGQPPDAVLLDVRLPDMSGLDAFDRIRQLDPRLPVIIMTAYSRPIRPSKR